MSPGPGAGVTLVEMMVALFLASIMIVAGVPALSALRTSGRGAAGAREMVAAIQATRWEAVARRRHRGLWFTREGDGWNWRRVEDGNGNGLRTSELRAGVDRTLSGPHRLEDAVEGVALGFPTDEDSFPAIPPRPGRLRADDDPIRFGRSDVVSFSPLGRSSSGTLYLRDGAGGMYAVVLFGPTTRVRVWRLDRATGRWSL